MVTSPVQVALRELMLLTKCYCDGQHPRLGHNCSFRPDVERVVAAIGGALAACDDALVDGGSPEEIRRVLLGLPADDFPYVTDTPNEAIDAWAPAPSTRSVKDAPHAAQIAQRLQDAALRQKEGTVDTAR